MLGPKKAVAPSPWASSCSVSLLSSARVPAWQRGHGRYRHRARRRASRGFHTAGLRRRTRPAAREDLLRPAELQQQAAPGHSDRSRQGSRDPRAAHRENSRAAEIGSSLGRRLAMSLLGTPVRGQEILGKATGVVPGDSRVAPAGSGTLISSQALQFHAIYTATTATSTVLVRGPSHSQRKMACQVPRLSFPSRTGVVVLDPTSTVLMCESELPSPWR